MAWYGANFHTENTCLKCCGGRCWNSCCFRFCQATAAHLPQMTIWLLTLESHCRPFASNLEQVADIQCAQVNSDFVGREMSSSLRATGWRPTVADWGGGMSACCTAGPIVTSEIVKRSMSMCSSWSSAISSIPDLYLYLYLYLYATAPA